MWPQLPEIQMKLKQNKTKQQQPRSSIHFILKSVNLVVPLKNTFSSLKVQGI